MMDLVGVEDSDEMFSEVDTASDQHLRESIERAVRTRRGTIREFPDRYVDLAGYQQARAASIQAAAVSMSIQQDLEEDERVAQASVTIGAPTQAGRVPFKIVTTRATSSATTTVEGEA